MDAGYTPQLSNSRSQNPQAMLLISFSDDEVKQIAEESPTFALKLAKMASQRGRTEVVIPVAPTEMEAEARTFLRTLYPKNDKSRCLIKLRQWAREKGYTKFSTLAGAKRLLLEQVQLIEREQKGYE